MFTSASSSTRVLSHRLATLHRCLDRTRCDIQKQVHWRLELLRLMLLLLHCRNVQLFENIADREVISQHFRSKKHYSAERRRIQVRKHGAEPNDHLISQETGK